MKLNPFPANLLPWGESLILFGVCVAVYLANGGSIASGDTVPNSLLALNLLTHHTVHFDAFRQSTFPAELGQVNFFFREAPNGHLSSSFPIGVAIVTLPIYFVFYLYLQIFHHGLDITTPAFEIYRQGFEKLAATLITAVSVVLFYRTSRFKFSRPISLVSSLTFAFATNTWSTSSQALWQHGSANLMLIGLLFCLLKVNRLKPQQQPFWLFIAGICGGLLPAIRPSGGLFTMAALAYTFAIGQWRMLWMLPGLLMLLPSLVWNWYFFGHWLGGYSIALKDRAYQLTWPIFSRALPGLLFSPGRGLFFFTPVTLFAFLGGGRLYRARYQRDEQWLGCLTLASLALFLSYCFFNMWWAGHCYGPRYMTDLMPVLCYLLNYALAVPGNSPGLSSGLNSGINRKIRPEFVFAVLLCYSILTQAVGAFGNVGGSYNVWNGFPLDVDFYHFRLWDFRDNPVRRHAAAWLHRTWAPNITDPAYLQGMQGQIDQIGDIAGQPIPSPIIVPSPGLAITAKVKNTGTSRWYGYESALTKGDVRVRVNFLDPTLQQKLGEAYLYVSGRPGPGEETSAIGFLPVGFVSAPYKVLFDLVVNDVSRISTQGGGVLADLVMKP